MGGCRGLFCDFISSFALAEQVDLAEKAFHDALARRNEAQIAYLREPSVVTREAFEGAKTAEAVALEILGCAAGNTLEEAIVQGFLELVETDSYAIWWYNRLQRPELDLGRFDDSSVRDLQKRAPGL